MNLLLATQALFAWAVVNYALPERDERSEVWPIFVRGAVLGLWLLVMTYSISGLWLAVPGAALCVALNLCRPAASDKKWLAEWEAGLNIAFLLTIYLSVTKSGLSVGFPFFRLAFSARQIASAHAMLAALLLSTVACGHVVRGVLSRIKVLPREEANEQVVASVGETYPIAAGNVVQVVTDPPLTPPPHDNAESREKELNLGRIIGYLERLIVVVLVANGRFESLGFLLAAKGLVRAKEHDTDRDFAEYVLVGTLLSAVCALLIGEGLRQLLRAV